MTMRARRGVKPLSRYLQARLSRHLRARPLAPWGPDGKPQPQLRAPQRPRNPEIRQAELLKLWNTYHRRDPLPGTRVCVGFMGKRRNVGKRLAFADLTTPEGEVIQICSNSENRTLHNRFCGVSVLAPIHLCVQDEPPKEQGAQVKSVSKRTVRLCDIWQLNGISKDIVVSSGVRFTPSQRHLQIRFHPELQARLRFRSWLKGVLHQSLFGRGFIDVETPALFKPTPEGAREFLVPTRREGYVYALSQSPQQYKQVLMASGITRYMQWARCFRDEDLRSDRQPEFSQLDMEWAFAGSAKVMGDVTDIILKALSSLRSSHVYEEICEERIPVMAKTSGSSATAAEADAHQFTTITFADSIAAYGTDKPDLRIPNRIHVIENLVPIRHFVKILTSLRKPLIEAFTFSLTNCPPATARKFVKWFMQYLPAYFEKNPDGAPQVLIHDSSQPLCGFSALGPEYRDILRLVSGGKEVSDGDLVVFQARQKSTRQYCLDSTKLGVIRKEMWKALVAQGYMEKPRLGEAGSLQFVWVTEFPMFKTASTGDATREGKPYEDKAAGLSATHHPFTAPLADEDFEMLFIDPLQARSAAYDLVLNGTEIGGGSERNHIAEVQHFIMQDVLRMADHTIKRFSHLFEALRAGCPPHAGFALGFDRMVALMTDAPTVRDVMAFPKTMDGGDPFVRSPSRVVDRRLEPYGLSWRAPRPSRPRPSRRRFYGRRFKGFLGELSRLG